MEVKFIRMTAIVKPIPSNSTVHHLRPFDARRDLNAVADLIELGFSDTLDDDGRRYLRQMRTAAQTFDHSGFFGLGGWISGFAMVGYVWEENNQVVGNVNLIPYLVGTKRYFLIANVVVYPNYRGRGIGRALTKKAVEHAQRSGAPAVWLHVRTENEVARRLYESLGFIEQARRITWHCQGEASTVDLTDGLKILPRRSQHWQKQRNWLQTNYPKELLWNLSLRLNLFHPGLVGSVTRFINNTAINQWAILERDSLAAVTSWQSGPGQSNTLWLAAPQEVKDSVLQALLVYTHNNLPSRRPLILDYPSGWSERAIEAAGFRPHQTLIWMKKHL
jgi:ribosomal protein S18 acetylase RimI-like enzyme